MKLSRRFFLQSASLATAAPAIALQPSPAEAAPPAVSLQDWRSLRTLFALDPAYAHLALFMLSSHPAPVREAIESFRKKLDADPLRTVEHAMFDFEHFEQTLPVRATTALGRYLGVPGDQIALVGNTTTGLALMYLGLPLKAGDEILTTEHDHFVHHEAIRLATERAGASWRKIKLYEANDPPKDAGPAAVERIAAAIKSQIRPNTRAVGVTWVHSSTGWKLPIRAIADAVGGRARLIVDGVHGIGVEDPAIGALGCDAFATGSHKWILGPRGTGFVWAKPELWAEMKPVIPSFTAPELFAAWLQGKPATIPAVARWFSPGGFHAFEHYWATPAAIELLEQIGPSRITARVHALATRLKDGLSKIKKVKLYTPRSPELSAGLVCFDVEGMKQKVVVEKLLEKKIIGSTTPYAVSYARLAVGVPNDEADVDAAIAATRAIAG